MSPLIAFVIGVVVGFLAVKWQLRRAPRGELGLCKDCPFKQAYQPVVPPPRPVGGDMDDAG